MRFCMNSWKSKEIDIKGRNYFSKKEEQLKNIIPSSGRKAFGEKKKFPPVHQMWKRKRGVMDCCQRKEEFLCQQ